MTFRSDKQRKAMFARMGKRTVGARTKLNMRTNERRKWLARLSSAQNSGRVINTMSHRGITYNIDKLLLLAQNRKSSRLNFSEINHPGKERGTGFSRRRYLDIGPSFPGLVTRFPGEEKYTLLDGRHRLLRLRSRGYTRSSYHIIGRDDLRKAVVKKGKNALPFR